MFPADGKRGIQNGSDGRLKMAALTAKQLTMTEIMSG
jgi:hypothetical protein